jgi:hypothetical protein
MVTDNADEIKNADKVIFRGWRSKYSNELFKR